MMQEAISAQPEQVLVTRRKVLYLSGYDPRGAGHYHTLYRSEAEKEQRRSGQPIKVSRRKRNGRFSASWLLNTRHTHTDYEFLSWDDLIRKYWLRNPFSILVNSILIYSYYISTGTAKRIFNVSKTRFIGLIFPLIMLLLLCLMCGVVATTAGIFIAQLFPGWYLGWPLGILSGYICYQKFGDYLERRFNIYWLLRAYYFFMRISQQKVTGLDERIDAYARHLLEQLDEKQFDEILLVGHSTGTILVPLILHRALEFDPQLRNQKDRLALLTLGHVIQDVSLFPAGEKLRTALRHCAASGIYWLDVTAPPDGACFPLVDVTTGAGVTQDDDAKTRHLISARFHKMLTKDHYRALKKDRLKLHFQYLMAGDTESEYNFFSITSGSLALSQRFRLRNEHA